MRFLIRFENKRTYWPADKDRLTKLAYEAVSVFGYDIGNLRVSSHAVELDLLIDSRSGLESAVRAIERKLGPLLTVRELDVGGQSIEAAQAIEVGLGLFNDERYWESHEALEVAWRRATGSEKDVLQAMILVAAALVHLQKNEINISLSVLKRASDKLEGHRGIYFGFDMSALEERLNRMLSSRRPGFFRLER